LPFKNERPPWGRWIVEFLLILASVYLAVFLESAYQARADQGAARSALAQLLGELREDRDDFRRIIEIQDGLDGHYTNLGRWLADPTSYPVDSVGAALHEVATLRATSVIRWNTLATAPLTQDPEEIERIMFRIERVHMSWNVWYRDLLIQYENDVDDAIAAVEEYLEAVGG
jgi:hypothetical protein